MKIKSNYMKRIAIALVLFSQTIFIFNFAIAGSITYKYDAQGRVIKVYYPNGILNTYQYDNSGSVVSIVSSYESPPSGNLPPVANTDSEIMPICSSANIYPLINDTDPDNNVPLSIISVTSSSNVSATLVDSETIHLESFSNPGSSTLTYKIQDSIGAQAIGTIKITVSQAPSCSGGGVISTE